MKRPHRFLALLLALTLLLSACQSASPASSAGETETAAPPVTRKKTTVPTVARPFRRAELDALPVARPDMTEEELRDVCVRYMVMMKSIPWTPDATMKYACTYAQASDTSGNLILTAGKIYQGTPYTSAAGDLSCFLDFYDEDTGVLRVADLKSAVGSVLGNTCSTAAVWSWARVSPSITLKGVPFMNAAHGYVPLGPVQYDFTQDSFNRGQDTKDIVAANGEETMFACYALLKPASGVMTYPRETTGHVRMCVEAAKVVRDDAGKINGDRSTVLCAEQHSVQNAVKDEVNGAMSAIGEKGKVYTFRQLFNAGYIAFEIPELCGRAAVEPASVSLELPGGDPARVLEGAVTSNYMISRVDALLVNESGEETELGHALGYCYEERARNVPVSSILQRISLHRQFPGLSEIAVTFRVRLGNGETVTLDPVSVPIDA